MWCELFTISANMSSENNETYKKYDQKLQKVLNQLAIPEYKIENDTYLEILLSQIAGKYDAGIILTSPS